MNLLSKKLIPVAFLALSVIALPLIAYKLKTLQFDTRKKAQITKSSHLQNLDINYFKTDYQTMKRVLNGETKRIGSFSGNISIAEFDDKNGKVYAGHIGSFWSPPFYSTHLGYASFNNCRSYEKWREGFNLSINFYNRQNKKFTYEKPSSLQDSFWYPSKMVVSKEYDGPEIDVKITGKKIPIPGYRAFGLKLEIENNSNSQNTEDINLLFLPQIPTVDINETQTWMWKPPASSNKRGTAGYDGNNQFVLFQNQQQNLYMVIGLNKKTNSWQIEDSVAPIYDQFKAKGYLQNTDKDKSDNAGTVIGLTHNLPPLSFREKKEVTILITIDRNENAAIQAFNDLKTKDIEMLADNFWNDRLNQVFQNIPQLETDNKALEKIYYNSIMNMLLNKWEGNFDGQPKEFYTLTGLQGQSMAQYIWDTSFISQIFSFLDPQVFEKQIENYLHLDLSKCKTYDPILDKPYCTNQKYSYSQIGLAQMIYEYVTISGKTEFFDKKIANMNGVEKRVIDWFEDMINHPEGIINFGTDRQLYEYGIHCDKAGYFNGYAITPNVDTFNNYQRAIDMFQSLGQESKTQKYQQKAGLLKTVVNQRLWNEDKGWFDTISLYDLNGKRKTAEKNTVWPAPILHILDSDQFLSSTQTKKISNQVDKFNPYGYGLCSFPCPGENADPMSNSTERNCHNGNTDYPDCCYKCPRLDWHGKGLYTAEIANILTGLFQSGGPNKAYDILLPTNQKGYTYLQDAPYWAEALKCDQPTIPGGCGFGFSSFINAAGFSQIVTKGMFGLDPKIDTINISPQLPEELKNQGISLKNIKIKNHIFDIKIKKKEHTLSIQLPPSHQKSQFIYKVNDDQIRLKIDIKNQSSDYDINILVFPIKNTPSSNKTHSQYQRNSNASENLLSQGEYKIIITPKSSCQITTDSQTQNTNQPISVKISGQSPEANQKVRLWLETPDRTHLPLPKELERTYANNIYYLIGQFPTDNQTHQIKIPELPSGDYLLHCDVNSSQSKCSGSPFCQYEGGQEECTDWMSCSDKDNLSFSVVDNQITPHPTQPNPTDSPTKPTNTPTPASKIVKCSGKYFGKPQCEFHTQEAGKTGGSCQVNPDLPVTIKGTDYWRWAYCYEEIGPIPTPTGGGPLPSPTAKPSTQPKCSGKYFGKPQCESRSREEGKTGGSCQVNPDLPVTIEGTDYWRWAYCY